VARKGGGAKAVAARGGHPGFAALVKAGVPAAALASASRNASPAAKKKNPRLKKVKGKAGAAKKKGGVSKGTAGKSTGRGSGRAGY